ncbi:MAG: DUF4160 domain-containing protein [Azospirillaceae bacterium]
MPTVLRENGFRFYFFSNEGQEPPHVHVDKADQAMKIWLETLAVAGVRMRRIDRNAALAIVERHRDSLLEAWHGFFSGR